MNRNQSVIDKVETLHGTELFKNLDLKLVEQIAALATFRHVSRGQTLVSEHEQAAGIYVIARGTFRSVRQSPDGREQVLSTERPGAVIGLVPAFNSGKFYSTMIADAEADVICIPVRDLHELCRNHAEILWNVARVLADRVRHLAELVETLALRNVEQRLAQYFLTIAQKRGVRSANGYVFELTLTRAEMASRLGSVREVVSRACAHLAQKGLIQLQGRRLVTIPDIKALGKFAGADPEMEPGKLVSELPSSMA